MADTCIECDVVIVGSGFAGSLIAKELSRKPIDTPDGKRRLNVVILEAGPGVQPNINGFMRSYYKAPVKVPESPYPPALTATDAKLSMEECMGEGPSASMSVTTKVVIGASSLIAAAPRRA